MKIIFKQSIEGELKSIDYWGEASAVPRIGELVELPHRAHTRPKLGHDARMTVVDIVWRNTLEVVLTVRTPWWWE